jgi:hypothetical protein
MKGGEVSICPPIVFVRAIPAPSMDGKAVRFTALLHLRQRICLRQTDLP